MWHLKFDDVGLFRNVSLTLSRQVLVALIQLATVVLVARGLGPEGNGILAIAILLPSIFINLLNLGVGPATVYFLGRGSISAISAVRENFRLAAIISVFGVGVGLPLLYFYGDWLFSNVSFELLAAGLIIFPISLLFAYWTSIFQGLENFRVFNLSALVPPCSTLLVTGLLFFIVGHGVIQALLGYIVGQAIGLLFVFMFVRKIGGVDREANESNYKRKLLDYGWKAHLANVVTFVNYRVDIILVNFFLTPAATGLYVVAVQLAERFWILSQAVSIVLLPRLSAMNDDRVEMLRLTIRASFIVGIISVIAAIVFGVALYCLLVPVFGISYEASLQPFLWLLPGMVAGSVSRIYASCIAATGNPQWNFYASLVAMFVNVGGNCILIPALGLLGAAVATSIAYGIITLMLIFIVHRTSIIA